ncbi:GNAT family N-acetyltransferase [Aquimarina sp. TRL1]|uniref:GNAT family N-acetyltransferase n=1 Tax=Aquimarina sp. (strain TRL1) TaxID=2736252 RepID=UPI0015886D6B|nr:GNAT family N-acetyltransferase [Aquimarina sp. TRL1]QKX05539.1 GNAT family N-acetyltransferase [Aquimarina sp. TRL1]
MITIRPAHIDDLPVLLDFEQRLIEIERPMDNTLKKTERISYYDIESYISAKDTEVIVAEIDQQVVGSGYAQIRPRKGIYIQDRLGYIGFMFVDENHRGKGIAKKVITSLIDWLKTREIEEVQLEVYHQNPSAIKAYEKAGFKQHLVCMRYNINE